LKISGSSAGLLFAVAIVLLLLMLPANAYSREARTIIVGSDPDYPPYEFVDKNGKPSGFNVELTRAIAEVMGMKVKFVLGGWAGIREAFDSGEIDLLQGISYSEERAEIMDFCPHSIVSHSIYARKGTPPVSTLRDLTGKDVIVMKRGIMHDTFVAKGYDIKYIFSETPADQLQVLASGKHEYAVVATLPAAFLIEELELSNIIPVAKSIVSVKYGYAVKKGNSELLAIINEGLTILKKTGRYHEIHQKWIGVIGPSGITVRKIVHYATIALLPLLIITGGTIVWSQTLKKRVAQRTEELEREIIERKRAEEELRKSQEQLRSLTAYMESVREEERKNIAREIHDELGMALTTLKLELSWLRDYVTKEYHSLDVNMVGEKAQTMSDDVKATIKTVQRIASELRPGVLDNLGLAAAIEWQAGEFRDRTGIYCRTCIDEDIVLDQNRSIAVFRIFQEALTNIMRYSGATQIEVGMRKKEGSLEFEVRDNGRGITEEQIKAPTSFGLIGMQERSRFLGGHVRISGTPGKGTRVIVNIPLDMDAAGANA